jgi:hypothetical protein
MQFSDRLAAAARVENMFFIMTLVGSLVLMGDGVFYALMGMSMLLPLANPLCSLGVAGFFASLYPLVFKECVDEEDANATEAYPHDEEDHEGLDRNPGREASRPLFRRMVAYLLLVFGFCRIISSLYWGCGPVLLGLCTCLVEIAMLCNEMMCYESVHVNRAMTVVLHDVAVSLLYIGFALPNCQ